MRGDASSWLSGFVLWWSERLQVQANPGRRDPTTPPPRPLPQIPFLWVGAGGRELFLGSVFAPIAKPRE